MLPWHRQTGTQVLTTCAHTGPQPFLSQGTTGILVCSVLTICAHMDPQPCLSEGTAGVFVCLVLVGVAGDARHPLSTGPLGATHCGTAVFPHGRTNAELRGTFRKSVPKYTPMGSRTPISPTKHTLSWLLPIYRPIRSRKPGPSRLTHTVLWPNMSSTPLIRYRKA